MFIYATGATLRSGLYYVTKKNGIKESHWCYYVAALIKLLNSVFSRIVKNRPKKI